jgi:DNA invertase Pin-like site-specific DNA recombinase
VSAILSWTANGLEMPRVAVIRPVIKRPLNNNFNNLKISCIWCQMALIGYARVSTEDQNLAAQREALTGAGCSTIFEEKASGGSRGRPQLAHALYNIKPGDTLIVTKIDRLARSLSHLLEIIERLALGGANFRSLSDPIDTAGPSGRLVLQMLGAVAEFERALIRERTVTGLKHAKSQGRVGGNPGLRGRDPEAIAKVQGARRQTRLEKLSATADAWLPIVRTLRPLAAWPVVLDAVNAGLSPSGSRFTEERLVRSVQLFVSEGMAEPELLGRAPNRRSRKLDTKRHAAIQIAAAIYAGRPDITLEQLGAELKRLRHDPPRGGERWGVSSVKVLLEKARGLGLLQG